MGRYRTKADMSVSRRINHTADLVERYLPDLAHARRGRYHAHPHMKTLSPEILSQSGIVARLRIDFIGSKVVSKVVLDRSHPIEFPAG